MIRSIKVHARGKVYQVALVVGRFNGEFDTDVVVRYCGKVSVGPTEDRIMEMMFRVEDWESIPNGLTIHCDEAADGTLVPRCQLPSFLS